MNHLIGLHHRLLITCVTVLFVALGCVALDWWRRRDLSRRSIGSMAILWLLLLSNAIIGGIVARQTGQVAGLHMLYGGLVFGPPVVLWYLQRGLQISQRARFWFLGLVVTAVLIHRIVATG
ncbi:MAG: hypothetical protein EBS29_06480 [Chloroflexia bacterium]|nr:hypothetical protein [Chloroflexia bacterium]